MNRIVPEQLNQHLSQRLAKVYFLVGQDPLLLSESEDAIYKQPTNKDSMRKITFRLIVKLTGHNS